MVMKSHTILLVQNSKTGFNMTGYAGFYVFVIGNRDLCVTSEGRQITGTVSDLL